MVDISACLDLSFDELSSVAETRSHDMGLTVRRLSDGALKILLPEASITCRSAPEGSQLILSAPDAAQLQDLRDGLGAFLPGGTLRWTGESARRAPGATRPANLTLAQISASERISPSFQRLRLSGDFTRFGPQGLHFRLIFGPEGAVWPGLDETGGTVWPGGIDSWHRPPYTVRRIADDASWIDVDLVLHEGGRVTEWLSRARVGDQVALTGPGGKAPRVAPWVALIGDETALPVIARSLAVLPAGTRGAVRLIVPDHADRQSLEAPEGIDLSWHIHAETTPLDQLRALTPPREGASVFFAAERGQAAAARAHLEGLGMAAGQIQSAAYWTEGWTPPEMQVARLPRRTA